MAKMTNQWLHRGQGLRNKSFRPVSVTVSAINPSTTWAKRNEIVVEINATRENYEFQALYLTATEARKILPKFLSASGEETRLRLAEELLENLSDADLHRVLASAFKKRVTS